MAKGGSVAVSPHVRRGHRFLLGRVLCHLPIGGPRQLRVAAWAARGMRLEILIDGKKVGNTKRPDVRIVDSTVVVNFGDAKAAMAWLN